MALYFSDLKDKSKTEQAIDYIQEALVVIQLQEQDLQKSILGSEKKIMPITNANLMGKIFSSISSYTEYTFGNGSLSHKSSGWYSSTNNVEQTCNVAKAHVEWLFEESKKLHEANLAAIENNKIIGETIRSLMTKIGIPSTYTTYDYTSAYSGRRTQKRQEHTKSAGYLSDLSQWVKISDGFEGAERTLKDQLNRIKEYRDVELRKEQEAQRAKQRDEQEKEDAKVLATLIVKYKCEYNADWRQVLEAILSSDKYLELGYWLERQRNSWADGFWKARDGINGFKVETPVDTEIYDEISSLLEDVDDGRVFRDCHYNYSTLYGMVKDEDLYKDFRIVFDKIADQLD